jgi:Segregation and condensation complex subunit ScpB
MLKLLDTVLFAAPEPVDEAALRRAARAVGLDLVERGGGWTLRTLPETGPAVRAGLPERVRDISLSRAETEMLVVIAYHQPVTRAEIARMRGKALRSGMLAGLLDGSWIRLGGRRSAPAPPRPSSRPSGSWIPSGCAARPTCRTTGASATSGCKRPMRWRAPWSETRAAEEGFAPIRPEFGASGPG